MLLVAAIINSKTQYFLNNLMYTVTGVVLHLKLLKIFRVVLSVSLKLGGDVSVA